MIIAVVNQKGGVGKSTISAHLAIWLKERGGRVALIDSDAQSSTSQWVKEASPELPIFRLQTADDILEQIPVIRKDFDHLVVDGPGSLGDVTRAILFMTDRALVPCGPSVLDLRASDQAIKVLRQVQDIRKGPPAAWFVPNKVQVQYRLSREFLEEASRLGIPASSPLKLRQAFADAVVQGTVVWKLGRGAKDADEEIQQLFQEITQHGSNLTTASAAAPETLDVGSSSGHAASA